MEKNKKYGDFHSTDLTHPEKKLKGRGALGNPANRFEHLVRIPELDYEDESRAGMKTIFFEDTTRSIIAHNDSPDLPFSVSVNPYRGCEHGCVYCYARPTHEYLGFSSGLDFETKIFVKKDAARLLRKEFSSSTWRPQVVAMSGVTDPYQPIERRLEITRQCLEVLAEFRNPVVMITKNALITRDMDIFLKLNRYQSICVYISMTTLDKDLAGIMEPRASRPQERLETIERLSKQGIPVGILTAPVIPGLNDQEIPEILKQCAQRGAQFAGYVVLRLPFAVKSIFETWLTQHFPDRKDKVLNRIRSLRDGKLNDPHFGSRMTGEGVWADHLQELFSVFCQKTGLNRKSPELTTAFFRKSSRGQLMLFEES